MNRGALELLIVTNCVHKCEKNLITNLNSAYSDYNCVLFPSTWTSLQIKSAVEANLAEENLHGTEEHVSRKRNFLLVQLDDIKQRASAVWPGSSLQNGSKQGQESNTEKSTWTVENR